MVPTESSNLRESLGRRLTKHKAATKRVSMDLPERLQDDDDAQEDAAVATTGRHMNQSIFSMIAAAGSTTNFQSRFDDPSSESEEDGNEEEAGLSQTVPALGTPTTSTTPPIQGRFKQGNAATAQPSKHRRESSKNRLIKSFHKFSLRPIRERRSISSADDHMSASQILQPPTKPEEEKEVETTGGDAPMMSRILKAEAEMKASALDQPAIGQEQTIAAPGHITPVPVTLSQRLKDIFGFEQPEKVISEWPCWLLQSVLVQGFMYLTEKHICFYAYLPKKATTVTRTGYLKKRGMRNPRYNRYYMQLKGDVLSYYQDPSNIYYPSGQIDLRVGISAQLGDIKDKAKDETHFTLTTDKREYMFKADSPSSARDWVKILQKVIFRSHNEGDSVKISLPIDNVMDIENERALEFADTVKIRVIDNDETYAIDEYFFSFFTFGQDAIRVLRIMVEQNSFHKPADSDSQYESDAMDSSAPSSGRPSLSVERPSLSVRPPSHLEGVRATLSPQTPIRALSSSRLSNDSRRSSLDVRGSTEIRRRSFDVSRASSDRGGRSVSGSRQGDLSPLDQRRQESLGSPTTDSMDPDTSSSVAIQSIDDTNASASQILNRSDVFQAPTILAPQRTQSEDVAERLHRASQDTARSGKQRPRSHSRQPRKLHKPRPGDVSPAVSADPTQLQASSSVLQNLMYAGSYPVQRASGVAGFLKNSSRRMSKLLATESMGYYEKVSGMWAGGTRHYGPVEGMAPDDDIPNDTDDKDHELHAQHFRDHFALPPSEQLIASYFGHLQRVLPLYGKIYIGNKHLCYRSLYPGTRTKLILPLKDLERVTKEKAYRLGYSSMVVAIKGHEEVYFDFPDSGRRDDCVVTLILCQEAVRKQLKDSGLLDEDEERAAEMTKAEHQALQAARHEGRTENDTNLPMSISNIGTTPILSLLDIADLVDSPGAPPILFDDVRASILNFKPTESLRITCLTIGSRGDVQPYIALCKGLIKEGHKPRIATHVEFGDWIKKNGIDFEPVAGDPGELMRICVENGMFTYSFMREASTKFRDWLDGLMDTAWKACQGSDLLIESPSAMVGIHIAEALAIPYFRAFTMPWTRTRAYPHAFAVPEKKMGGNYNYLSYVLFDAVFWKAISGQVNRWRKKQLGLGATGQDKMQTNKTPFLYNFSPRVVAPPLDYSDWIRVTGYWFLDEEEWDPPADFLLLENFIRNARKDGKKLVYVGFGSIVVDEPRAMTKSIIDAVIKADVRCILSKGWSDRLSKDKDDHTIPEIPLPPEILQIKYAVPHSWLFAQVDAAAHHGGSGTTGASLRAGIPTIIKPFFGDQFFFGGRVEDLGVGVCMRKLNSSVFARALWQATHDERMISRAKVLGEAIRAEDGVGTAIKAIYRDMEYAKTLIKQRKKGIEAADDHGDEFEESWTFIGDESDPELQRAIAEWEPPSAQSSDTKGKRRIA